MESHSNGNGLGLLRLKVAAKGHKATLKVSALRDPACQKIVVHLGGTTRELAPGQSHRIVLSLPEIM